MADPTCKAMSAIAKSVFLSINFARSTRCWITYGENSIACLNWQADIDNACNSTSDEYGQWLAERELSFCFQNVICADWCSGRVELMLNCPSEFIAVDDPITVSCISDKKQIVFHANHGCVCQMLALNPEYLLCPRYVIADTIGVERRRAYVVSNRHPHGQYANLPV